MATRNKQKKGCGLIAWCDFYYRQVLASYFVVPDGPFLIGRRFALEKDDPESLLEKAVHASNELTNVSFRMNYRNLSRDVSALTTSG